MLKKPARFLSVSASVFALIVAVFWGFENAEKTYAASTYIIQDTSTGGDCTTIGTWNDYTKTCTLTGNVSISTIGTNDGVEISSNGITLDCASYSVSATGSSGASDGIFVNSVTDVIVKNCTVSDFANYQILFDFGSDNFALNNTVNKTSIGTNGIYFQSSNNGIAIKNTISGGFGSSIYAYNSSNVKIYGNTISGTPSSAIRLYFQSDNNRIIGNTIGGTPIYGIDIGGGGMDNNIVKGNTVNSYGTRGIIYKPTSGTGNSMDANIVLGSGVDIEGSIYVTSGTNNTCDSTTAWNDSGYTGCRWSSPSSITCGSTITQNTQLTGSILSCGSNGITMSGTNNILLDCNGYTIDSSVVGSNYGVDIIGTASDLVIQNCTITDFERGVGVTGNSGNSIVNNSMSNNTYGTYFNSGINHVFVGNTVSSSSQKGFYAGFGSGHIIYGNEVSGGAEGIASGAAEGLTCVNNYIHNGSGYGLNLQNSTTTPHTVLNNIIDSQGQGMYLVNIDNAMISKNIVTSSTGTGAYLISGATGNTLTGNFISNSSSTGIRFSSDSTGNTLGGVSATDGNVIISNTTDVYDEDSNSGDNNTCNVVNNWRDTGLASDGCTTRTIVTCGDGFIDGAEDCDDGGTSAGDGCSATCTIETGYGCLGEPSSCQLDSGFTTSAGIANAAPSFNSTPSEEWDATTYGPLWSSVSNTSTNHLYEVIFIGAEGWVVGDNGELMYSDDSGTSWTQQTSSTSNGLYAIDCVDTSNCWAVGLFDTLVRTSNGGTNWATVSTGTSGDHFYGVDFVSSTQGWMVDDDGDIRVTSNGGDNWTLQTSGTVQWLRDIQMLNSSTGYAVGGLETVLKTINGGTDWTTQTTPGSQYLYDIYCTDASNCWAVGNGGTIIHTSNGGTDWTAQTSGTTTILRAVHFSDANNGWVAGDSGMTLYTTNGGTTWTEEDTDSARRINGIWVFSATSVLETGDKNPSAPIILKRGAIKTESSTALPTPAGETLNFVVTDSDPNLDDYYLLVCKNSSAPTGGAPPECNGGSGNRWARSAATTSGTKATASYVTSGSDAISNDWWAFTCDASDCSSASQGSGNSGSPFIVNHGPTLSNFAVVEANDPTDITPDPGEQLQFQFTSSDQDSDDHTIVVCDSSGFTDSTQTCVSEEICRLNPEEVATTFTDEGTVTPNAVGIDVISRDIAFAVGASGYIGKTTNGGTSWTTATSPYSLQYWGLSAIDEKTAWAVGVIDSGGTNEGTIVATINGTTWSAQTSGVAQDLWDVFFVDANYGWAVGNGGTIIATTNGGTNWSAQTSGTANDLNAISFLDRNNGWVAGSNGTILVTTNGGTNWSAQTSGTANYLASIEMVNKDVGYAGSVSTMRKTTNGGTTWSAANWPGVNFNGMHWVDENIGFVAANNGGMYYTTDGAATAFNSISTGSSSTMWSVDCTDKNFCMVGSSESNSHKIINEVATASAWSSLTSGTSTTTNDLEFIDENNGWIALGSGAVRRTNDGGDNWSASTTGSSSILMDIHFIDPQVGWIVGTSGEVRKTTTGGASDDPNCAGTDHWCTQTSGETTTIRGIHFVDADNGWFVGDSGKIRVTSDGGTTWTTQTSGTAETLRKADFIDPDTGWIVGHSGTILVTSNGGGTWTGQTSGTSNHLYDVSFVDSQYGWASGGSGTILTTSNGGTVWTAQTSGVSSNLYGIKMIDKNTGWTVGIGGEVLFTADGGTTWTAQTSGTASDLWGIAFISENIGFAAGGTGTVIKVSSLSYCNETDSDPNDGDPSPVYIGVPEAHGSKAYTIHTFDEHNVPDDGTDESQNFSVGDVPPYISNNTDYTVTDITLTAGGYAEKTYTVAVKDDNGDTDLVDTATGYLYDTNAISLTSGACTPADTNCYTDATCTLSNNTSGTDNEATATCAFTCSPGSPPACSGGNPLWFNANYSANWRLHVNPVDGQGTVTNQADSTDINVEALSALNITQLSIVYGSIALGGTSSGQTITVENLGNQPLDLTVEGDDMCSGSYAPSCPGDFIPVAQQKWHHNSATFNWNDPESGAGPYILEDDTSQGAQSCSFGVDCYDTNGCLNRDIAIATSHSSPINESFYSKILIPSSQAPGSYAGFNTVTAVASDSCMGTLY